MRYKIGQKVRVVDWPDVANKTENTHPRTPPEWIGKEAIIEATTFFYGFNLQAYLVGFGENSLDGVLFFERELKPIIKVGQQLMLWEDLF